MNKTLLTALTFVLGSAVSASASTVTLDLPGSGSIVAHPGETAGWGFSLTNTSGDFLVVANSFFCEGGQSPASSTCSPHLGSYSDRIATNAMVVDPGSILTQAFDPSGTSGLGSFSVASFASRGQTDTGSLVLIYDLFSGDPFTGPATQIGGDQSVAEAVQVTIGTATAAVPEPALPLAAGLLGLALLTLRRRVGALAGSGR